MLKLYYSDIRGVNELDAKYPPTSESRGSALGVSLLAAAYDDYVGGRLPFIKKLLGGKPVFADTPQLHFSVSHSRTHVLCALSDAPVGVDTQDFRDTPPRFIEKLTTDEERRLLSFFDIWALRESLFKLVGQGDLRTMRFYKQGEDIIPPIAGVKCRLYDDIPNSSTAVCIKDGSFPEHIIHIPVRKLLKKDSGLLS